MSTPIFQPVSGVMCQGYDSVQGKVLPATCVTGSVSSTGGTSTFQCVICYGSQEVADTLDVKSSLSVSYGLNSLDVKVDYFHSLNLTDTCLSIVVYAKKTDTYSLTNAKLIDPAVPARASDEDLTHLVTTYGDSFVSSYNIGGEYYAVYTCFTSSREEFNSLEVAITAKGGMGALSGSTSNTTTVTNLTSSFTKKTSFNQKMFGLTSHPLPDEDGIVSFAAGLNALDICSPVITSISTTGLEGAAGFTTGLSPNFDRVRRNRDYFNEQVMPFNVPLQALSNQIDTVLAFYNLRGHDTKTNDPRILDVQKEVQEEIAAVRDVLRHYKYQPLVDYSGKRLNFNSLKNGSPSINLSLNQAKFGNGTGNPQDVTYFSDNLIGVDPGSVDITYVKFTAGSWTRKPEDPAMTFQIDVDYDGKQVVHGRRTDSTQFQEKVLSEGVKIVKVSGRAEWWLVNLRFDFSDGTFIESTPQFGAPQCIYDTTDPNIHIYGFFGNDTLFALGSFGVYYYTIQPCLWSPVTATPSQPMASYLLFTAQENPIPPAVGQTVQPPVKQQKHVATSKTVQKK